MNHRMPSFVLPPINDNSDGGWGPSASNFPNQFKFKDIPYAPYSKSDKLGRFADWNDISSDNRQTAVGLPSTQGPRAPASSGRRRDGTQAFGSGTASAFAYFHAEDEASFSLVDNKATAPRRGGAFTRGRGTARATTPYSTRGVVRGARRGTTSRGSVNQRGAGRRWRDWDRVCILKTHDCDWNSQGTRTIACGSHLWLSYRIGPWLRSLTSVHCVSFVWKSMRPRSCESYFHIFSGTLL